MTRIVFPTRSTRLVTLILAGALASLAAHSQQTQPTPTLRPPNVSTDASGFSNNDGPHDPEQARMLHEMSHDRNVLRQKEIVQDTNQLMDLVRQLKDAVDKSNKDELSLSVVNTAAEIEKLAKSVKEKMRDGQ
ncbi:MAG TPA: hypothetical protein VL990_03325 [Acidobacteriaceae bacterium]|nr:hypothetical protein [Acidobacteriaceae bacterium]